LRRKKCTGRSSTDDENLQNDLRERKGGTGRRKKDLEKGS